MQRIGTQKPSSPEEIATHWVERLDREIDYNLLPEAVEQLYKNLAARAKDEESVILSVVQTSHTYNAFNSKTAQHECRIVVLLTAQRMRLVDIEEQQRRQRLLGSPNGRH